MSLASRVQSLDHATTVTKCDHIVAELHAVTATVRTTGATTYGATVLDYIGAGIDKQVYGLQCGVHVLKICRRNGQGATEVRFWKESTPTVRKILAPVRAATADGSIIVADRVTLVKGSYRTPPKFSRMAQKAEDAGIDDLHSGNVGILKGRCVVLDYGFARLAQQSTDTTSRTPTRTQSPEGGCSQCGGVFECCADDHECLEPAPDSRTFVGSSLLIRSLPLGWVAVRRDRALGCTFARCGNDIPRGAAHAEPAGNWGGAAACLFHTLKARLV